jgi:alpha-ketoglutarate-dependent taurine dioxygenase
MKTEAEMTITDPVKIDVRPLEITIGGEVQDIDLHSELSEAEVRAVRDALLERKVLVFPRQSLTPDELERFSRYLGEPFFASDYAYSSIDQNRFVIALGPYEKGQRPSQWHQGGTWKPNPWPFEMLQLNVIPSVGGDTLWADLQAAYSDLSLPLRELVDQLHVAHLREVNTRGKVVDESDYVVHPLVLLHPETGIPGLYLTSRISHIVGLPKAESDALLGFLRTHASHVNYQFRHRWTVGDLLVWDNRASWHYAVDDYEDAVRHGYKISVEGGDWIPVGPKGPSPRA